MSDRQIGRTTQQMKAAPIGAVFVWLNCHVGYPKALAKAIGRDDLVVRSITWLQPRHVIGRTFKAVIVDHAANIYDSQARSMLNYLRDRGVLVDG